MQHPSTIRVLDKMSSGWMRFWLLFMMLMPILILLGLIIRSLPICETSSLWSIITGNIWKPAKDLFGFKPFIISSVYVTLLALLLAVPVCIFSAMHICFYARHYMRQVIQPVIDILAGIPSVVYGVWGILAVIPAVRMLAEKIFNISTNGYNILSGGIVLAVMIIPFMLNILIDLFHSLPTELQEASLSLGAGKWYTIKRVMVKKAMPGIISTVGLGLSRAFGETMAVLMVVGNVTAIPNGIFDAGYPLPALIANNYGEMMSIPKYDAALMFAALLLLVIVVLFNLGSRILILRYAKNSH